MDGAGAQVGEHAHALAQGEQALFGAAGGLDAVPLGAADAAHEHGVGRVAGGEGLVGEGHAERVDGRAAELALIEGEAVTVDGGDPVKDLDRLCDDLRADVIAGEGDNMGVHGNDLHGNRDLSAASAAPMQLEIICIKDTEISLYKPLGSRVATRVVSRGLGRCRRA